MRPKRIKSDCGGPIYPCKVRAYRTPVWAVLLKEHPVVLTVLVNPFETAVASRAFYG